MSIGLVPANKHTLDLDERLVDVVAPLVPQPQPVCALLLIGDAPNIRRSQRCAAPTEAQFSAPASRGATPYHHKPYPHGPFPGGGAVRRQKGLDDRPHFIRNKAFWLESLKS